jgi:hypothetical protein
LRKSIHVKAPGQQAATPQVLRKSNCTEGRSPLISRRRSKEAVENQSGKRTKSQGELVKRS